MKDDRAGDRTEELRELGRSSCERDLFVLLGRAVGTHLARVLATRGKPSCGRVNTGVQGQSDLLFAQQVCVARTEREKCAKER